MKRYIMLSMFLVLLLGLSAVPIVAQVTGIHGACKDQEGKPITDGVVEITSAENGRKMSAKTDKNGEYHIIGLTPVTYDALLMRQGKQADAVTKIPIGVGDNPTGHFDLKKDIGAKPAGTTEDEHNKTQENASRRKIKGLNASLAEVQDLDKAVNYDQAITILLEVTAAEPTKDLLWAYLADAYRGAKKYPEAIDAYQKALAINPTSGAYHNGLADAYAKAGQSDKAVAEYNAAAAAEPANAATYYFNEGAIFTNTGKVDEAIAAFDKTIQADPKKADAYYWKGVNMIGKATLKGDKMVAPDGTADAFNKYLELDPSGKYADAAKQMLASIGSSVETTFGKPKAAPAKKKPN
jgi:tetratricopeptide (TPR) repeat protein